jgi:hypothetical protein
VNSGMLTIRDCCTLDHWARGDEGGSRESSNAELVLHDYGLKGVLGMSDFKE